MSQSPQLHGRVMKAVTLSHWCFRKKGIEKQGSIQLQRLLNPCPPGTDMEQRFIVLLAFSSEHTPAKVQQRLQLHCIWVTEHP